MGDIRILSLSAFEAIPYVGGPLSPDLLLLLVLAIMYRNFIIDALRRSITVVPVLVSRVTVVLCGRSLTGAYPQEGGFRKIPFKLGHVSVHNVPWVRVCLVMELMDNSFPAFVCAPCQACVYLKDYFIFF